MYQYKAILRSTKKTIIEGHDLAHMEHKIIGFRRKNHNLSSIPIDVYHVKRNQISGKHTDVLVKTM